MNKKKSLLFASIILLSLLSFTILVFEAHFELQGWYLVIEIKNPVAKVHRWLP